MTLDNPRPIIPLDSSDLDISLVGGKGVNIAKMISNGFSVPPAYSVTVDAYEMFLDLTGLKGRIAEVLESTDFDDEGSLESSSEMIRNMFLNADLPEKELRMLKDDLSDMQGEYFAVRSSAVAEDLADASFAGQQDTFLNVKKHDIVNMVLTCWASYWNARAMKYRHDASKDHLSQGMAVVIQKMVASEISGVMFTSDPVTGEGQGVRTIGGFLDLSYQLTADWSLAIGYGFDNPDDTDAKYDGARTFNDRAYIDAFYQVTTNFKIGIEYARLTTKYADTRDLGGDRGGTGTSDRFLFSAYYDF